MRIGIDYRPVLTSRSGIGRYTRGVIDGLGRLMRAGECAETFRLYACHVKRLGSRCTAPPGPAFELRRGPVPARLVQGLGRLGYGAELHFGRVDLFHFTDFTYLPFRRTPHVLTLHDLSFAVEPAWHEAGAVAALTRVVERLVPAARLVLVHSEHTAAEAARVLSLDRARVRAAGAREQSRGKRVERRRDSWGHRGGRRRPVPWGIPCPPSPPGSR